MRAPKREVIVAIQVLLLFILVACADDKSTGGKTDMEIVNQTNHDDYGDYGMREVGLEQGVPRGFVPLNELISTLENGLSYVFWETQISFLDADHICIYQTSETDESFIVRYEDMYYVNAEKFSELATLADATFLARNQVYTIRSPINIRFRPPTLRTTTLTVVEVSYVDNHDILELSDDEWLCFIKINLEVDYGGLYDREYYDVHKVAWKYFDFAENTNGNRFTDVLQDDSDEIITIRLPRGETIKHLYVTSPMHAYKSISRVVEF